jgi:uncharacterized protein YecE (DUF72 family)
VFHVLRVGCSGFQHSDWKGIVYPQAAGRALHSLEYLSRFSDMVELTSTWNHPLRPEIAQVWCQKIETNPRFRFTALLGRQFVIERDLRPSLVTAWKAGLRPLKHARRLGTVVMQFPWAFRFSAENRNFLIQLRREFHEFPLVAEFRHSSWMLEEAQGTLIDYRIGLVNTDQPEYFRGMPASDRLTSPTGYFRFHGRSNPEWHQSLQAGEGGAPYLYGRSELESALPAISKVSKIADQTFVVFTNSTAGRSMVNALQLRSLLEQTNPVAPPDLLERYWRDLNAFRTTRPVQSALLPQTWSDSSRNAA